MVNPVPASTRNLAPPPDRAELQRHCQAMSVLDAILSQEWESRYFSYNRAWTPTEEFCEMRDGEGNHMLILFHPDGCVISTHAMDVVQPDKAAVTAGLPAIFHKFVFGEPVATIGTTFCLWSTGSDGWSVAAPPEEDDGSEDFLAFFVGGHTTYLEWATEYYEGSYVAGGIPVAAVESVFAGEPLTRELVLSIVDELEDWEQLAADLDEIGYPSAIG